MIGFRDMTFCSYHVGCADGASCHRALTEQVLVDAKAWWGGEDAPIAMFTGFPGCWKALASAGDEPKPSTVADFVAALSRLDPSLPLDEGTIDRLALEAPDGFVRHLDISSDSAPRLQVDWHDPRLIPVGCACLPPDTSAPCPHLVAEAGKHSCRFLDEEVSPEWRNCHRNMPKDGARPADLVALAMYRDDGRWFFDDASRGIIREEMVLGADALLDKAADGAARLVVEVSASYLENAIVAMELEGPGGEDEGGLGSWYRDVASGQRVWLCPTLGAYFNPPPSGLWVRLGVAE